MYGNSLARHSINVLHVVDMHFCDNMKDTDADSISSHEVLSQRSATTFKDDFMQTPIRPCTTVLSKPSVSRQLFSMEEDNVLVIPQTYPKGRVNSRKMPDLFHVGSSPSLEDNRPADSAPANVFQSMNVVSSYSSVNTSRCRE